MTQASLKPVKPIPAQNASTMLKTADQIVASGLLITIVYLTKKKNCGRLSIERSSRKRRQILLWVKEGEGEGKGGRAEGGGGGDNST